MDRKVLITVSHLQLCLQRRHHACTFFCIRMRVTRFFLQYERKENFCSSLGGPKVVIRKLPFAECRKYSTIYGILNDAFSFFIQLKDMTARFTAILLILLIETALCSYVIKVSPSTCIRQYYQRGFGAVPTQCGKLDKIGDRCYSPCPAGYSRKGTDCHQKCPYAAGWADQGLTCRVAEYGRGPGYAWTKGGASNTNGMFGRCEKDHGKGNCESFRNTVYPKCKSGYTASGCCICKPIPNPPNCQKLGYNNGTGLSCLKKVVIGTSTAVMNCLPNLEYDAGLCYPSCSTNHTGIGPICLAIITPGQVACGMGSSPDATICSETRFDREATIVNIGLSIGILGSGRTIAIEKDAVKVNELRKQFQTLKELLAGDRNNKYKYINWKKYKWPVPEKGKDVIEVLYDDPATLTNEDIARVSTEITAYFYSTMNPDYPFLSSLKVYRRCIYP